VKISARDNGRLLNPVSCQSSKEIRLPRLCSTSVVVRPADAAQRQEERSRRFFVSRPPFSGFSLASVITAFGLVSLCVPHVVVDSYENSGPTASRKRRFVVVFIGPGRCCCGRRCGLHARRNLLLHAVQLDSTSVGHSIVQSSSVDVAIITCSYGNQPHRRKSDDSFVRLLLWSFLSVDQLIDPPPSSSSRPQMAPRTPPLSGPPPGCGRPDALKK
jgi:hypothetical protein